MTESPDDQSHASDLQSQIAVLRPAARQIARELGYLEGKNPALDISMAQLHALVEIEQHGMLTVAELARIMSLNQSSVCRTLSELRRLGWVETCKLPNDKKRKPVQLTALGKQKMTETNGICDTVYAQAFRQLSPAQCAMVVEAFSIFAQAMTSAREAQECNANPAS